jgi:predicted GTPase
MNDPASAPQAPAASVPRPLCTFVDVRRALLDLARDLGTLETHAEAIGLPDSAQSIRLVLQRLEGERYNVAIVGEFNRGKSTLINALLGVHVAPMDILACTAVLTRVTYALEKRALIEYKNNTVEEIPYDALPSFVTKLTAESAAVAATIERASVFYPSPYCLNNVDVIDTPGLNEDQAMTAVTLSVLPQADAAVMVIMAESPFGNYERDFVETRLLSADLGRVLFVVNGIDRLETPDEVRRTVAGVKKRIEEHLLQRARRQFGDDSEQLQTYLRKIGEPQVFGVSARQAFLGKTQMDADLLQRSGFAAFESSLQHFLTEQRGLLMMQPPLNRVLTASHQIIEALRAREGVLRMSAEAFDSRIVQADEMVQAVAARCERELAALEVTRQRVQGAASQLSAEFVPALEKSVREDIVALQIRPEQLKDRDRAKQDVEHAANCAMSRTVDVYNERLRDAVSAILSDEAERLRKTDRELAGLMTELRRLFSDLEVPDDAAGAGDGVAVALSLWTGFGGIASGYRSAGVKGAAVGLGASIGTAFLGGALLAVFAAPVSLPLAVVGLGLLSWPVGRALSDRVFAQERVERFKRRAAKSALANLRRHLDAGLVGPRFADAAMGLFNAFQQAAERGAAVTLNDARQQLNALRLEHASRQTATEHDRAAAAAALAEIEAIQGRARALAASIRAPAPSVATTRSAA